MRVLQPKEGQTYLYFYNDADLNPSQDIAAAKRYLREIGCKIGPPWKREEPEYYMCNCEKGEFRLVNDVPAIFVDSNDCQVIKFLAARLMVVCHKFKVGTEVRLNDGCAAWIKDYINEDYIIDSESSDISITESEIICKRVIPDNIVGKRIKVSLKDVDFGEYEEYEGTVLKIEMADRMMLMTIEVVYDWDLDDDEEPSIYEKIVCEDEIIKLQVLEII